MMPDVCKCATVARRQDPVMSTDIGHARCCTDEGMSGALASPANSYGGHGDGEGGAGSKRVASPAARSADHTGIEPGAPGRIRPRPALPSAPFAPHAPFP